MPIIMTEMTVIRHGNSLCIDIVYMLAAFDTWSLKSITDCVSQFQAESLNAKAPTSLLLFHLHGNLQPFIEWLLDTASLVSR